MTKIHVCCGGVYLKGYVNIDKYPFEAGDDSRSGCVADLLGDVFDLPYAKGSLSEIVLVHGLEHFTRYDSVRLLEKFVELLTPDGVLYLEMPSRNPVFFLTLVERVFAIFAPRRPSNRFGRGPASSMFWGNQWAGFDYETHRYLWSAVEVVRASRDVGLVHHAVFRLPASHIPFRDMGVAVSRAPSARAYCPPVIRRRARSGLQGNLLGFARGTAHVILSLFRAPR
ncbi:class I SAM-dependent methyltransferase [Piscinibacter sp.]|uniref:class I SAM-dependent methyltransferase n=1 Tax=Piscinibacter sp. TaxID=1903157 RepID=UPI001DEF7892|nr:class I SAM-dependent methyltransferase [Piscinibacter sp.]MBK7529586.1 class I SAM-dependent methyltransferase [Piscinibacter sp.]